MYAYIYSHIYDNKIEQELQLEATIMKSICREMLCVLFIMILFVLSANSDVTSTRKITIARKAFVKQFEADVASGKYRYPKRLSPGGPDPHHH